MEILVEMKEAPSLTLNGSLRFTNCSLFIYLRTWLSSCQKWKNISHTGWKKSALPSAKFISEVPARVKLMVATVMVEPFGSAIFSYWLASSAHP